VSNSILTKGTFETGGDVELEFKLLTFQEAESLKVGLGRNEPNKDPFLEMPKEGRDWLDKFSFIGDLVKGLGSLYGSLFKWLKIFGVIITISMVAYVVSTIVKV
jgi:hypothetical protein